MSPATAPSSFVLRPSRPRSWTPSHRDQVIFKWVKFDGYTQDWVAEQLELSQSTVSRIIERYERWIARGGPGASGGLSHDEQIRYQRWMAYERNERILASCLRIAADMERQTDVSRTTVTRNNLSPSQENEIKTYHETLDRTGTAARFLRLAYRINMDQLKLVEQEPLPALDLLTEEEADFPIEPRPTVPYSELPAPASPTCSEANASDNPNPIVPPRPEDTDSPSQPTPNAPARASTMHNSTEPISYRTPDLPKASATKTKTKKTPRPAYREWPSPPESTALTPSNPPQPSPRPTPK